LFRVPFNVGGVYRRRGGEGVVRGVVRGVVARRVVERRSVVEAFTVVSVQRAPAATAHGPSTEGAGTWVCGYAIKNSGLIVK
jgi:hypothetical protein